MNLPTREKLTDKNGILTPVWHAHMKEISGLGQSYTPLWTASSVNPAIGSGTIVGRYITNGNLVTVSVLITMAADTTFGSGIYSVSLPFTSRAFSCGPAWYHDSGTVYRLGEAIVSADGNKVMFFIDNSGSTVGESIPFTWANGDELGFTISYER